MGNIEKYFSSKAGAYNYLSERGLWKILRKKESEAVINLLTDVSGQRVLDLGSGAGYYSRLLLSLGASHVYAVDFSKAMLDQISNDDITPIHADCTTVELNENFLTILSAGTLEFLSSPKYLFRNAYRMATSNTQLLILVPNPGLWGWAYKISHALHNVKISCISYSEIEKLSDSEGWIISEHIFVWPFTTVYRLYVKP